MQLSSGSVPWHSWTRTVRAAIALAAMVGCGPLRAHADCVGDCLGNGEVTVDGVTVMVNIALGTEHLAACPGGDQNDDGKITVNEVITAANNLVSGCSTPVADAVARDADGIALHLGQTLTTEGVVTVSAGLFARQKLKIFVQDGDKGIMVYDQSSADVPTTFQVGQRLRATGMIRQQDPTSDNNPATGTVLIDITPGMALVVSDNNPLPEPQLLTLATLNVQGVAYTGTLVRVTDVQKVSGNWPTVPKSTQVGISDDEGATQLPLRLQPNAITPQLVAKLSAIGNGPFTLVGIVVQNDESGGGTLLTGFEIWLRGADDVISE